MDRLDFSQKAYNALYKAMWYPRIYAPGCVPVLVYSMAKAGTTTLRNTLYRHGIGPVFWAHTINRARIAERPRQVEMGLAGPTGTRFRQDRIRSRFIEANRPLRIVTAMREAVAREISGFFQRFQSLHGGRASRYADDLEKLQPIFDEDIVRRRGAHSWFLREYEPVLGLNIFEKPFPHDRGFQILRHGHFDILLLRMESPDTVKEQALGEFFGASGIRMYHANIGSEKDYAETYRRFRQRVQLPASYLDACYALPDMQHFYTPEEISAFRAAWASRDA